MSSLHVPSPTPPTPKATGLKPIAGHPKGKSRGWVLGLFAIALAALGLYTYSRQPDKGKNDIVQLRTAPVTAGKVQKTLRLTGNTAAEKYVSLIAPSLRGSRTGAGSGLGGAAGAGIGSVQAASVSSTAGGRTSSVATGALGSIASTSEASGGGSTAGRGSTSRISSAPRSPSAGKSSNRDNTAVVDDNIGSTASQLTGGGGGGGGTGRGGGGGDFTLLIQDVKSSGSPVSKGDKVAEFDRQYMMNRLDDYRASVVQAEMTFKKLRSNQKITRQSHDQQVLAAKNAMDKADLDMKTVPVLSEIESERLKLALEEVRARYKQVVSEEPYVNISEQSQTKSSEIDLEQAKIELKRAEANADKMIAKAPMNGVVVVQSTFRGSEFGYYQQGDQVYPGQMFMQVVDPASMVINASVNQADVDSLRIGMRAMVRFDAYPGLELPARLVMVGAIAKQGLSRYAYKRDVPVRLRLEKMDARVIPDLSVSADVMISEEEAPAVVPMETIFDGVSIKDESDGSGRDNGLMKAFVFVKSGEQWVRREVQVGIRGNTHAAIRSGLKPGEIVAADRPPEPAKTKVT